MCFTVAVCALLSSATSFGVRAEEPAPPAAPSGSASPRSAEATVDVLVLHATRTKERRNKPEIDPRIGQVPELEQEPFDRLYDKYELLEKKRLVIPKSASRSVTLPNERVLRTTFVEPLPKGALKISASINKPGGETFLPLLEVKARPGQAFIVAGQSYKNGILVLVFQIPK
jgi:hypothetical protein